MRMLSARRRRIVPDGTWSCPGGGGPAEQASMDAMPTWSPDGSQVQYVRDRFPIESGGSACDPVDAPRTFSDTSHPSVRAVLPAGGTVLISFSVAPGAAIANPNFPVAWSPDGRHYVTGFSGSLDESDPVTGSSRSIFHSDTDVVLSADYSPDGTKIVVSSARPQPTPPSQSPLSTFRTKPDHVHRQRRGERRCHRWRSQLQSRRQRHYLPERRLDRRAKAPRFHRGCPTR